MINVSQTYKDEIYNDDTVTKCSVVYGAYDVSAKSLATASANNQQTFSPPSQTINALNNYTVYTDLEMNNWVLDGSVRLFPSNTSSVEWGWWSQSISGADGTFATNPTLTFTWSENHSSVGITLSSNSPLKEFKVYWYDLNNTLLDSTTYTNTDLSLITYQVDTQVANYQKIVIEFVQTIPYHYIKIQDVMFGKEYIWQSEIISLEVDEQIDEKIQRLESKQMTVKLGNIDGEYNKYNPSNKLQFFQEGQIMQVYNTAYLSSGLEQVPLGQFYLTKWGCPTPYTVEFKGNDMLYKLNDLYYYSKMYSNATVKTIVDDLLTTYSATIEYNVDDNIKDVQLTGYIPIISYREALQHIAFSAGGTCYVDRYGVLQIKRLDSSTAVVDTLGFTKKAPSQDEQGEMYNSVTVSAYSYSVGDNIELFRGTVTGTQILPFTQPATNITVTGTYTSYTAYTNCVKVVGASGEIAISGNVYDVSSQPITAYLNNDTVVGITKKNMPVDTIYLIGTTATATYVATWLLNCLQASITNEFQWLSNPSIEVGDYITLEVAENLTKKCLVRKNRINYQGALSESSEVVVYGT